MEIDLEEFSVVQLRTTETQQRLQVQQATVPHHAKSGKSNFSRFENPQARSEVCINDKVLFDNQSSV